MGGELRGGAHGWDDREDASVDAGGPDPWMTFLIKKRKRRGFFCKLFRILRFEKSDKKILNHILSFNKKISNLKLSKGTMNAKFLEKVTPVVQIIKS